MALETALLLSTLEGNASPLGAVRRIACAPGNAEVAAAVIDQRVWTTRDGGRRWQMVETATAQPIRARDDGEADSESSLGREPRVSWRLEEAIQNVENVEEVDEVPSTETIRESANGLPVPFLAVSDDGILGIGVLEGIVIASASRDVIRTIPLEGIRDLLFDRKGGLWALTDRELLYYNAILTKSVPAGRWELIGPVDMASWRPGGEPVVLDRRGVWSAPPKGEGRLSSVLRMEGGDAVSVAVVSEKAAMGSSPRGLYVHARYRVFRVRTGERPVDLGAIIPPVEEMLVGVGERIRVRISGGVWFEKERENLRPLKGLSMAVDALGRFWVGTQSGPLAPLDASLPPVRDFEKGKPALFQNRRADHLPETRGQTLSETFSLPDEWRRPPPCRRSPMDLMPAVRLFLGLGHGGSRHRDIVLLKDTATLNRGIVFGVHFSWGISSVETIGCVQRLRRYHDDLQKLRIRALGLSLPQHGGMDAGRGATTLEEAIRRKMASMRRVHLLRAIGGG